MVRTIGIVGAGRMGSGIAHVAALAGYEVTLVDRGQAEIDASLETIRTNLGRQARRGAITEVQRAAALGSIAPAVGLDAITGVDLVIEAVFEDEAVKKSIFAALRGALPEHTIICTNSSSLPVTRLAASTDRPGKFMGMHFMNPVPMMELVELVRGIATEQETYEIALSVTERMGKTAAMAEDFPAFIVNRILMPMVNEAIYALYEGVGTVKAIDTAMKLGAHHRMGPLELADFIGLDTCNAIMQVLYEGLADSKYRPCPLLVKYVEAGWLGRKTGKGFYDYSTGTPVPTR
jgi:3-hydroxybutyryl-CoA dehydrogenase